MTDPEAGDEARRERVRVRRAPRLGVFVLLGVIVGVVVSLILTSAFPVDPKVGFAATAGYFALYGIVFGALLGAIAGLVLDAISRRRSREADVERTRIAEQRPDDGSRPDGSGAR